MQKDWDADAKAFLAEEKVETKIGKSFFSSFVKNHEYIDTIIEAIQNDHDAESSETSFDFFDDKAIFKGNGRIVSPEGWIRLSYTIGVDSPDQKKTESIGNKNHGVRSYLLYGDEILFSSGGKRAKISFGGNSPFPKDDELTKSRLGVHIRIDYRSKDNEEGLQAFTIDQERKLLEDVWLRLPGILSRLEISGWDSVLSSVSFSFSRLNVGISLVQEILSTKQYGEFIEYHRLIRMKSFPLDSSRNCTLLQNEAIEYENIEYIKVITLEPELTKNVNTSFFRSWNGNKWKWNEITDALTIGISFRLDKGKVCPNIGHLYYPIELISANTGNSFSITAPFVLDSDRKSLEPNNKLNERLLKEAGKLIGPLFKEILLKKFGLDSYRLLCTEGIENTFNFQESAVLSIKESNIILNNTYDPSDELTDEAFCKIGDCYQPISEDLYGFISSAKEVSNRILDEKVKEFFKDTLGVTPFTIVDVTSLWIHDHIHNPSLNYRLLSSRWNYDIPTWNFSEREGFIKEFCKIDVQKKYADTFVEHEKELSDDIKREIKTSFTTLNSVIEGANETHLNAANYMQRWSHEVNNVPKLDLSKILHPDLGSHRFYKDILNISEFSLNSYIIDILKPSISSMKENDRIQALDFLLSCAKGLTPQAVAALKDSEIFRSDTDKWCKFYQIVNCPESVKKAFGESLFYPHLSLQKESFLEKFSFETMPSESQIRKKVEDLWQHRKTVEASEILDFQAFLQSANLTPNFFQQIAPQILTVDKLGVVCEVSECYDSKPELLEFIGSNVHYIDCQNRAYFDNCNVNKKPRFQDMIKYISELKNQKLSLSTNPSKFYIELAEAKKRDCNTDAFDNTEIIFIGHHFVAPSSVFIYKNLKKSFFGSMNYWDSLPDKEGRLRISLVELGCKERPDLQDFLNLLRWLSNEISNGRNVDGKWKDAVHWSYQRFGTSLPPNAFNYETILLVDNGSFTSIDEAASQRVFYNDSDDLASAMKEAYPEISFFDTGQRGHSLFQNLQIPKLSDNLIHLTPDIAEHKCKPSADLVELFRLLRSKVLINGLKSYVEQNQQLINSMKKDPFDKLVSLSDVGAADAIYSLYQLKDNAKSFRINRGCRVIGNSLFVNSNLEPSDVTLEISKTIAELIVEGRYEQSSVLGILNTFLNSKDIKKVLAFQGYSYHESIDVPELEEEDSPNVVENEVIEGEAAGSEEASGEKEIEESHNSDNMSQEASNESTNRTHSQIDKLEEKQQDPTEEEFEKEVNNETSKKESIEESNKISKPTLKEIWQKEKKYGRIHNAGTEKPEQKQERRPLPKKDTPSAPSFTQSISERVYSEKSESVKSTYFFNCQFCLAEEKPENLEYSKSYAAKLANRRRMIEGHHIHEVKRDRGHDAYGNILSLCKHHHKTVHKDPFGEPFLTILRRYLNNTAEKEIVWRNGEKTTCRLLSVKSARNPSITQKIVFTTEHLEFIRQYLEFIYGKNSNQPVIKRNS